MDVTTGNQIVVQVSSSTVIQIVAKLQSYVVT